MSAIEVIEEHHNWFHYVANGLLVPTHPDHDDVVQEGRIAMWKNYDSYDGREDRGGSHHGFLRMCSRRRMLEIAYQRKPPTGHEPLRNSWRPPTFLLGDLLSGTELTADDVLPPAPDVLEGVETAYHRGELIEALGKLTEKQRNYVVLRFWGGLFESPQATKRDVELAPEFSDKQVRYGAWTRAKANLEQYLDHVRTGYGD